MVARLAVFSTMFALLELALPAFAQSPAAPEPAPGASAPESPIQWQDSLVKAKQEQASGRNAEAAKILEAALQQLQASGGTDKQIADVSKNLADVYGKLGRLNEAEAALGRALELKKKALGDKSVEVAILLNAKAALSERGGKNAEAEAAYKQSLAIREKALGPDNVSVATALNNLAGFYDKAGRSAEAEPLYKRALSILEDSESGQDLAIATTKSNLAMVYIQQKRYSESEQLFYQALKTREKELGEDHLQTAALLYNLASLRLTQKRYTDALELTRQAVEIAMKKLGANHPTTREYKAAYKEIEVKIAGPSAAVAATKPGGPQTEVDIQKDFALTLTAALQAMQAKDFAQAAKDCEKSFALAGKLKDKDLITQRTATIYGAAYDEAKRYPEAQVMYFKALQQADKNSPTNGDLLSELSEKLAQCYVKSKNYAQAEQFYKLTITLKEKTLGSDSPKLAVPLNELVGVYSAQGKYGEAEEPMKRSVKLIEKVLGTESSDYAISLNNLASLYRAQGKKQDAEALLKQALSILVSKDPDQPSVAVVLTNYAGFLRQNNREPEAVELEARAKVIESKRK